MKKRVLSILLVCCMVFSLLPVTVLAADNNIPFEDVKTTDWFYDEVCFAYEHGLMQGTSSTTFDPTGTTSRAMIVTILYHLEGEPALRNANVFTDVVSGSWYEKAVVWANDNGIVAGYGNGKFGPNDPITREQLATIMYHYANYKGHDTAAKADLSDFVDSGKISSYALDAMKWANAAGLINGIGASKLDPQGDAARAQAATILMHFCEEFVVEKTYTVTFDLNCGSDSIYTTLAVKNEEKAVQPTAPTRSGYTFAGWYKNAVGGDGFDFDTAITADLTLYAHWTKNGGDTPYTPPTPVYPDLTIGEEQEVADGVYKLTSGIYNDVTISEDVGDGDVTLDGVTIKGKLIVLGGGSNSIHLDGCTVDAIEVSKASGEAPRIELNSTPVEKIEAVKPVIIEADKTSAVKAVEAKGDVTVQGENTTVKNVTAAAENVKLTVKDAAVEKVTAEKPITIEATSESSTIKEIEAQSNVTVQGAATKVDKVTVPESAAITGVELKIEGAKVAEVAAEKPVTIEATAGASPIEKVEAKDNVTVQGAQIETVTVPENVATKPEITVTSGTVSTVEAKSEVKVEGGGTVSNVKAEAPVEVNSATVTTITVTVQVTVTVTGTQPVEVAVETTNAVSVVTANTNVSVSTTLTEEVNVVTKATEEAVGTKVTHVHKWVEDTTKYVAPTCSATGTRVYVCGGVGDCDVTERTKTETLSKLPHTEQIVDAEAATCTATGLTAGKTCKDCHATIVAQQIIPALSHAYATVWSSDGEGHWHECIHCGEKADSAAHTPGAAATETTDQTCTVCGYVITPSLGHQCASHLTKTAAKAATCTAAGNNEYYTCTCGKFYSNANATTEIAKDSWIIPATGHDYGTATYEWKAVSGGYTCTATRVCSHNENHKETETVTASYAVKENPTCQKEGTATYTATFTNGKFETRTEDVKIAKLLHKEVKVDGTPATCEKTGLTDGVKCSVCDTVLVEQKPVSALGHDWATEWSKDGTQHWHECQREGCDAKNDAADHVPGAAATESSAQTCTVCGYVMTPALGHVCKNHLTAHEAVAATCTTAGNSAYWSCTCGKFYSDANAENEITENSWVISALSHNLTKTDAKSATCEENGNDAYWTCSICHKVYADAEGTVETTVDAQTRAKLGHNYRAATYEWTAVNGGYTCTATRVCANNGNHKETETVTASYAVTTPAACESVGQGTYTATFTKEGFATQTKTEEIAVLGHIWETAWSKDEAYHWHVCQREGCDAVNEKSEHSWNEGVITTTATGTQNGVKTYTCTVCGATKTETIPASYASVSTVEALAAAMESDTLLGAVVSGNIEIGDGELPAGKTVIVQKSTTLTVTGKLEVCGTLKNEGTIENKGFVDVFGALDNSGTFTGNRMIENVEEEAYSSDLGIEGGATLTNTGTIKDCITVADYYYNNNNNKICVLPEGLTITERIAVAFGAEQVKSCLQKNYDVVVPVGNINLGDITITIPAGKLLRVKGSVFDGGETYTNNNVTVANVIAEGGTGSCGGIDVYSGGSLTITGTLTLATSSEEYYMDDSGYIEVEKGGSLKIGDVQYVGENGAFTLGDNTWLALFGLPQDAADEEHPTGIFAVLQGDAKVNGAFTLTDPWDNFINLPGSRLTVNGTLTNNIQIENRGDIEVTGTLVNNGGISNQSVISVTGGKLSNHGVINGERGEGHDPSISIENGARIESHFGGASINNHNINVTDYWRNDEPAKCTWDEAFDPASGDFEVMAVAFGPAQIQAALDAVSTWGENNEHSAHTYECVVACGTNPAGEDEKVINRVELGGITVPEYTKLQLCNWFAADGLYLNDYIISEGTKLTLDEGSRLECVLFSPIPRKLTIDGEIVNNGGSVDYGGFNVNGKNGPAYVNNTDELNAALTASKADIRLCEGTYNLNSLDIPANTAIAINDKASLTISGNLNAAQNSGIDVMSGGSLTVTGSLTLATSSQVYYMNDSGYVEVTKGGSLSVGGVQYVGENGAFTLGDNTWLALFGLPKDAAEGKGSTGIFALLQGDAEVNGAFTLTDPWDNFINLPGSRLIVNGTLTNNIRMENRGNLEVNEMGKLVNNGEIVNTGGLFYDRDPRNGQFSGNEPIEYASLRDLVCEMYHRFDGMPNMESVDYKTTNQWGVEDLHWVYDYPDGGSQMYNKENPNDSDYDAIGAFSWFIKNGIIPEYSKETSPELRPYDFVTKEQAATLLNKLGNRILGTTGETYSDLSGGDYLCRTNNIQVEHEDWKTSELLQAVDKLEESFASLRIVKVKSEEELVAALDIPYVTKINVTQSMTIMGTSDSSDPNFNGCFYLDLQDGDRWVDVYICEGATLTVGSDTHTTKLDIGDRVNVILNRGENSHARVVVSNGSCINVFGGLTVSGDNWDYNEFFIGNINRFPDVMDLGRELLERLRAYELPPMTEKELVDNHERANEWPDGDDRIDGFKLLVKHGGLEPITEKDDQGNDYIVWRPYNKITYGVAIDVLTNVYKVIDKEATGLPTSVALGDEAWTPNSEHLINDHDLEELLNKFVDALPKIKDSTTTNITLIRDRQNEGGANLSNDGMTITGKTFTKHVTITCDTEYLNNGDDFGGELKFVNCDFAAGVTVKMTDGVNFRVDFGNSCTGNAVVALPDEKTSWQDCRDRTNVELFYVSGMSFDTTTNNAFADFNDHGHDKTVSFTLNGMKITDEGGGAFNINARYDENGKDNENQPIFIPTVEVTIFAQANEVKVSGNYTGKLRISGNADVSKLALSNGGFIELGNSGGSNIDLGGNTIFVNGDCGGEYSFTGTANSKVIVRDQNRDANITVNNVHLGTPHIFGEHGDGIFFPLASTNGVPIKVEQRRWDEEQHCDVWTELEYNVIQEENMLQLVGNPDKDWIDDPNWVRVTVTVANGCTVVYDTMMWKPVQIGEFVDALNYALGVKYAFHDDIDENWQEYDYVTYGMAKEVINYVKAHYDGAANIEIESIIKDKNYWAELKKWTSQYKEAESSHDENWLRDLRDWNPDNWTWDWFFANGVIRNLKSTLGIKDAYDDVEVYLIRENDREALRAKIIENEEWFGIDGNRIANCRFNGTVTVFCGTERSGDDDFGGCIFFENCEFKNGVTVELKQGINYGVRFNNCTGTVLTIRDGENTLAPITLGGANIAVDVRYDECGRDEYDQPIYIATAEIRSESKEPETITVSGSGFNGKLRISGSADVSGLSFGTNGWLELSNNGDSAIALGDKKILVNDDCGGEYSFIGTTGSAIILPNQNQYANITVNGINLGTPHIFGRDSFGIFFPLTGTWNEENNILTVNEGTVTFTVEQGRYSEDLQRVPDDAWTTLECTVEVKQDGSGIHIVVAENESRITDPYQVRVTVKVANGCTVVYDTMMWKPVQMDEFIEELNNRLEKNYTLADLNLPANGDLTFGDCKTAFTKVLSDSDKTNVEMSTIIDDERYWNELEKWTGEYQEAKNSGNQDWIRDMENRNPDNWTRRWNDLDMMLDELTEALGISNDDGQQ